MISPFFKFSVLFLVLVWNVSSMSILSVDWGSENIKLARVSQKTGQTQIILNEQNHRLIPNMIALRDNRVFFGESAQQIRTKKPESVFSDITRIMGNTLPSTQEESDNFRNALASSGLRNVIYATNSYRSNTFSFSEIDNLYNVSEVPLDNTISPEELLALQYAYLIELSEDAGHPVEHMVISVPPYYTDLQRKLMQQAGSLLEVSLDVVYDTHALTSAYGIELIRADALWLDGPARTVLLIDSGASTTRAHLVEYAMRGNPNAENDFYGTHLATGWSTGASGSAFDFLLALEVIRELDETQRQNLHGKPFERILKESKKVKEILSANKDATLVLEDLFPGFDVSKTITREQFEAVIENKANEIVFLIQQVILDAKQLRPDLTPNDIEVQIVGGNSRIPLIQKKIREAFENDEKKIETNLNGDEAVVEGAFFMWPLAYYNFQTSPNSYAVRIAELEEPGIFLTGSAESPAKVYGLAFNVDSSFAQESKMTLEFFYYPPNQFRLLPAPQSPRVIQIQVELPEDRPAGDWSVIVQVALPLDPSRRYIKVDRSDTSFEQRITPIGSLENLAGISEIVYEVFEFGSALEADEIEYSQNRVTKLKENEFQVRKQEKIESDLESLVNEGKEVLESSEISGYIKWGEKGEIEEQLKAAQAVLQTASSQTNSYDIWEDAYTNLQKAIDKPKNRYLSATGKAPKEASRRHKTRDSDKKESMYPESKVTTQEKLTGVAVIFIIGIAIYVGFPAVKKVVSKKSGHKLGGKTLKQLQEQAKRQKQD